MAFSLPLPSPHLCLSSLISFSLSFCFSLAFLITIAVMLPRQY